MQMVRLKTRQLLDSVAKMQDSQSKNMSRDEIKKKIDEIKYLSGKNKVPRLSLQKEILHLENKLGSLFDVERRLLLQSKRENSQIVALKKQVSNLKLKLDKSSGTDIETKIEKLTYVLGELLAKSDTADNVRLREELEKSHKVVSARIEEERKAVKEVSKPEPLSLEKKKRILGIISKAASMRELLEKKLASSDTDQLLKEKLELSIFSMEKKLERMRDDFPELEKEITIELEKEKAFVESMHISAMPSQISAVRSHMDVSTPDVKHKMIIGEPGVAAEPSVFPMASGGAPVSGDLEAKVGQGHEQQVQGMLQGQVSASAIAAAAEEHKIEEELIAELPLPPPPRIRRK